MKESVEVRVLTPELSGEYFALFDDIYDRDPWLNFKDNPWWGGCYCTFFDDFRKEADQLTSKPDKRTVNKARRKSSIESGTASGLLAFVGGKVVGWCNVAPRVRYVNPRHFGAAIEDPSERVGSITCFVIQKEHRMSGVATQLLASACAQIKLWNLAIAEAYPGNPELSEDRPYELPEENASFRGTISMYSNLGFKVHRKLERIWVMRKAL